MKKEEHFGLSQTMELYKNHMKLKNQISYSLQVP